MDNYSSISGGSFYLEDNESFIMTDSYITNSTAYLDGGVFYITDQYKHSNIYDEENGEQYVYKLINITADNISKMFPYDGSGMFICMKKYAAVYINNFHGKNYNCGKKVSCSVLALANDSLLLVDDFILKDTNSYSKDGFIIYIYEYLHEDNMYDIVSHSGPKCAIRSMTLTNINMLSDLVSYLFFMEDKG
ncbi:hypothetical protein PIROE2DRAFT_67526, partial [Piromyces sp. E2]